jgi:LCP family protein required for cell wall assembly
LRATERAGGGPSGKRRGRRWLAWTFTGLLLVAGVGILNTWSDLTTAAPNARVTDIAGLLWPSASTPGSLAWKIEHDQRVEILLLARGGAGHDSPNFTDTILVLSIRPATGIAVLVSLPRFLWAELPALVSGGISGKLYSAFALGGQRDNSSLRSQWRTATGSGDLAAATVAGIIGEPIDAWVAIDNTAFQTLVDALGGIRVTVPTALDDLSYPVDDTDTTKHVHFDAGPQTMNGTRALEYARSRLSTSEKDRSERQQLVMTAILARLRAVGLAPALLPVLGALKRDILTNLDLPQMRLLYKVLVTVRLDGVGHLVIDESNVLKRQELPEGDYILVPRQGSFAEVQRYVQAALP